MTTTESTGVPVVWGVGAATALTAISCATASLIGVDNLDIVPDSQRLTIRAAVVALVVGVTVLLLLWHLAARARSDRPSRLDAATTWLSLCLFAAVAIWTRILAGSLADDFATLRLLDVGYSVPLALIGLSCAVIGMLCVGAVSHGVWVTARDSEPQPMLGLSRSTAISAAVTFTVCAAVVAGSVVVARPALTIQQHTAPEAKVPAFPESMDTVTFRHRIGGSRVAVIPTDGGFVTVTGDDVTAYDASTGAPVWSFDGRAIGGIKTPSAASAQLTTGAEAQVLVLPGESLTVGLDVVTGAVRWRSADPWDGGRWRVRGAAGFDAGETTQAESTEVTLMNPDDGTVQRRISLPCSPKVAVTRIHVLRTECGAPNTLVVAESATGREQRVTVDPTIDWRYRQISAIGSGHFAATFTTRPFDDGNPTFTAIIEEESGSVVDQFTSTTTTLSALYDGKIALIDAPQKGAPFFGTTPAVMVRDVHAHRWTRIPAAGIPTQPGFVEPVWLGDTVVVGARDGFLVVNPRQRSVTRRPAQCLPGTLTHDLSLRSLTVVPGAVLAVCFGSRGGSVMTEIVGLR
ncbi:PQQ-binding-like beta-propeller repeat protein [Gordonia phthalatica]|uniref:Pyrrolo-quinoline quinone repeat domain-containing protein n=1 Tax=Gordonia phthalatica TaxID=1136941 RepID=A0A0N9N611_9ACTN|nr:PQQ-binding-like beta-propeller repeat protein [Gordonia phthalatica]ALG85971.1 hypothetical protein ACH46_17580 [Gordonia phthalatica]